MWAAGLVAFGGALGSLLRWAVGLGVVRLGLGAWWGTLAVNVVGCGLMGLLAAWGRSRGWWEGEGRLFWAVGVLGGFTTFSAFALDAGDILVRRGWLAAAGYGVWSVGGALVMVAVGWWIGRALWSE